MKCHVATKLFSGHTKSSADKEMCSVSHFVIYPEIKAFLTVFNFFEQTWRIALTTQGQELGTAKSINYSSQSTHTKTQCILKFPIELLRKMFSYGLCIMVEQKNILKPLAIYSIFQQMHCAGLWSIHLVFRLIFCIRLYKKELRKLLVLCHCINIKMKRILSFE